MENGIVVCVPGSWENRTKFIEAVVTSTRGDFMFAGKILAHAKGDDHVNLDPAVCCERNLGSEP